MITILLILISFVCGYVMGGWSALKYVEKKIFRLLQVMDARGVSVHLSEEDWAEIRREVMR